MRLQIGHLYPRSMNTYGDTGNIICLVQRAAWRGIEVTIHSLEIGEELPSQIDLYFFGGGQDAAQEPCGEDLRQKKAGRLKEDVLGGVPLLAICGGYQLLGEAYLPFSAPPIVGAGIFPVTTSASPKRMIGDLVIDASPELDLVGPSQSLVGFENHSGQTKLKEGSTPLGTVRHGFGNNWTDRTEGCLVQHAIGCYLHGPLLPKNPHLADWLLRQACQRQNPDFLLSPLDDQLEWQTHHSLVKRYV